MYVTPPPPAPRTHAPRRALAALAPPRTLQPALGRAAHEARLCKLELMLLAAGACGACGAACGVHPRALVAGVAGVARTVAWGREASASACGSLAVATHHSMINTQVVLWELLAPVWRQRADAGVARLPSACVGVRVPWLLLGGGYPARLRRREGRSAPALGSMARLPTGRAACAAALLAAALAAAAARGAAGFKEHEFRKCKDSGFCVRHRERQVRRTNNTLRAACLLCSPHAVPLLALRRSGRPARHTGAPPGASGAPDLHPHLLRRCDGADTRLNIRCLGATLAAHGRSELPRSRLARRGWLRGPRGCW